MKNPKTYLIVGGVTAIGIATYYLLRGVGGALGGKTLLTISSGANGSTNPIQGAYQFNRTDYVTITATPDNGYNVNGWSVDGNSQGSSGSITLKMDVDHDVVVTFTSDTPVNRIPTTILTSPTGTVPVKQPYTGQYYNNTGDWKWHNKPVTDYTNYDGPDTFRAVQLTFTAVDPYQQPCANVPLLVYTDAVDYNNGEVWLTDMAPHHQGQPLRVVTGADGIATVNVFYRPLNISEWSKKRLYYASWVFWQHDCQFCLEEGSKRCCGFGCTGEEVGVSYNAECPNATVYGREYEFQQVPMGHIVKADYESNTAVSGQILLSCWIGIKAPPASNIQSSTSTPSTPWWQILPPWVIL